MSAKRRIALLAGNREFPLHVARAARALEIELVAIALHEETSPDIAQLVPTVHWIHLGQVGRLLEILRRESLTELVMAGQVHPSRVTKTLAHLDAQGLALMARAATGQGRDLLKLFTDFLTSQGITLLDSSALLKDWVPQAGVLTARRPTAEEEAAIAFGRAKAEALATSGVGQTVVVKANAVVAVEGMDGTDATIRRAGEIAGPGTVVVKMAEPGHDRRFDIPVVGAATLEAMAAAGATALAMTAGTTLLLDRPALIQLADRYRLTLVALA